MSLVDRRTYIQQKKTELFYLVRVLEDIYGDKDRLSLSIKKCAVLGDGMSELRRHPDKVLEVFLPLICSYGGGNTGLASLYHENPSNFEHAVDTLLENGVDDFYSELRKVT